MPKPRRGRYKARAAKANKTPSSKNNQTKERDANNTTSVKCPYAKYGCDVVRPTRQHISQCPMKPYEVIKDDTRTFTLPPGKIDVAHATALFQEWMLSQPNDPLVHQKRQFDRISADPEAPIFQENISSNKAESDSDDFLPNDGMTFAPDFVDENSTFGTNLREQYGRSTFHPDMRTSTSTITYDDYTSLQVMLMSNIMQYRGVPLSLFDSIQHTIRYWALERQLDFNRRDIFRTRESLLTKLQSYHGMSNFKADMVNVPISRGRVVGVVVFDVVGVITNMFSDNRIFCPENIAEGYNIWNGESAESTCYGEVHTGTKFKEARDHFIGDSNQFPIPLVGFYDKTHTDNKGGLCAAPFNITLAFLNMTTRMKSYAQFPIGIVPNLKYGLSSDENITPLQSVQDEQDCLYVILKQLIDIEKNKGFDMEILGMKVTGRPWIHFCIGDIEGFNRILACYADNSGKTKRPNRMCKCESYVYSWEDMNCEWVELKEVEEARKVYKDNINVTGRKGYAKSVMKDISRHPIETVWEKGVPIADQIFGMNILTPPELLHTVGVGIAKYILGAINKKLGNVESQILDRLHAALYSDMKRNSDRDFYESSLQKGSTESVKQSAMENIGNVFAILCLSVTVAGNDLLTRNKIGSDEKDVSHPLKMFMACIAWFHHSNPKEEVHNGGGLVAAVLHDIIEFFDRGEGNGWDIPKCHAWLQFTHYIKLFGNAANFWGGPGEHSHIRLLKDNAKRTQKQIPKFGKQLAERIKEDVILEKAEESLIYQIYDHVLEMPKTNSLSKKQYEWRMNRVGGKQLNVGTQTESCKLLRVEGKYRVSLNLESESTGGLPKPEIVWSSDNAKKKRQNRRVCFEVLSYLAKAAKDAGETEVVATGYSCAHVQFCGLEDKTIIRCTDRLDHKEWYDYVAFKRGDAILPAKVCGILNVAGEKKLVVHAASPSSHQFDILKETKDSFLAKFSLRDDVRDESIYTISLSDVVSPLIVFPDYGSPSKTDCVCVLPKRHWAEYFSNFLRNSHFWPHENIC